MNTARNLIDCLSDLEFRFVYNETNQTEIEYKKNVAVALNRLGIQHDVEYNARSIRKISVKSCDLENNLMISSEKLHEKLFSNYSIKEITQSIDFLQTLILYSTYKKFCISDKHIEDTSYFKPLEMSFLDAQKSFNMLENLLEKTKLPMQIQKDTYILGTSCNIANKVSEIFNRMLSIVDQTAFCKKTNLAIKILKSYEEMLSSPWTALLSCSFSQ